MEISQHDPCFQNPNSATSERQPGGSPGLPPILKELGGILFLISLHMKLRCINLESCSASVRKGFFSRTFL